MPFKIGIAICLLCVCLTSGCRLYPVIRYERDIPPIETVEDGSSIASDGMV